MPHRNQKPNTPAAAAAAAIFDFFASKSVTSVWNISRDLRYILARCTRRGIDFRFGFPIENFRPTEIRTRRPHKKKNRKKIESVYDVYTGPRVPNSVNCTHTRTRRVEARNLNTVRTKQCVCDVRFTVKKESPSVQITNNRVQCRRLETHVRRVFTPAITFSGVSNTLFARARAQLLPYVLITCRSYFDDLRAQITERSSRYNDIHVHYYALRRAFTRYYLLFFNVFVVIVVIILETRTALWWVWSRRGP